ncbi:MAG TPA: hypothetical protein VMP01_27665, partial [Pirellulaceae bacterium]|nr:hypothetical protein [Pirellulaceae bacterium]
EGQKGRGGGRGGIGFGAGITNVFTVAGNEAVQKEIGADEATVGKIRTLNGELREALQSEAQVNFQELRNLSDDERRTKMREFGEKRAAVVGRFEPKLKEALSADQYKRVREIYVQALGVSALTNRELAKELEVSDEQARKISEIQTEFGQKRRDLGRDAAADARQKLSEEELKAATAVLTKEQQDKFTALRGKEFDTSVLRQGRGGDRPGGGDRPAGGTRPNRTKRPATE